MVNIITIIALCSNNCSQSYFSERYTNVWQMKAQYLKSIPAKIECMVILCKRTLKLLILFSQTAIKYNLITITLIDWKLAQFMNMKTNWQELSFIFSFHNCTYRMEKYKLWQQNAHGDGCLWDSRTLSQAAGSLLRQQIPFSGCFRFFFCYLCSCFFPSVPDFMPFLLWSSMLLY